MSYKIKDGRLETSLCELNVAHHCNLSCRSCSHLSPRMEPYFVGPDQVFEDLSILAQYCHPQHVRLLGGEPLLHPHLLRVIDAVCDAGITECIRVVTNGVMLDRMPDAFWQKVNQVHVSLYPAYNLSTDQLSGYRRLARDHNVELQIEYAGRFRESFSELGTTDSTLTKRIYSTCQIAHAWRCQAIFEGHIYRCSPSIMISRALADQNRIAPGADGLKLSRGASAHDLRAFLESKEPLAACKYCLGSVGKRFAPEQESRQDSIGQRSSEEMINWKYLKFYELVGARPTPYVLQRIGNPVKRTILGITNSIRNKADN